MSDQLPQASSAEKTAVDPEPQASAAAKKPWHAPVLLQIDYTATEQTFQNVRTADFAIYS
jgi:hypothetical protein